MQSFRIPNIGMDIGKNRCIPPCLQRKCTNEERRRFGAIDCPSGKSKTRMCARTIPNTAHPSLRRPLFKKKVTRIIRTNIIECHRCKRPVHYSPFQS